MPKASVTINIDASREKVFDIIHDYDRRLQWDTLLRRAELLNGAKKAGLGIRAVCAAKWSIGGIAIKMEYIVFDPPKAAAIKMVNRPLFLDTFAATIRNEPINAQQSKVTYIYNFSARPKRLSFILNPIMNWMLSHETKKRLSALKNFLEKK